MNEELQDAIARILSLGPDDFQELALILKSIEDWIETGKLPDAQVSRIQNISAQVKKIIFQEDEQPEKTLADIAMALEKVRSAIEAADDTDAENGESLQQTGQISFETDATSDCISARNEVDDQPEETPQKATASAKPVSANLELPADHDRDLLVEFMSESLEYIEQSEIALLNLETNPDDSESINTVFRAFHTIKGTAAFLGLEAVAVMAHRAESMLSRMRDGEIRCTGGYADLALRSADMLKELIQSVGKLLSGEPASVPQAFQTLIGLLDDPEAAGYSDESSEHDAPRVGDILVAEGKASREAVEQIAATQGGARLGAALIKSKAASALDIADALRTQKKLTSDTGMQQADESSVRVKTTRLDDLVEMVGELVISHSMISQDSTIISGGNHELVRKVSHTGKIVREMQDLAMSMRMVPLKSTFQKMARVVRDVSHKNGKLINFISQGEETEIDRNMVDIIKDPLVHMIRNAVDHGVEAPEVREAAGKQKKGTVILRAYHASGNVVIELIDDGRGLDRNAIIRKAVEKGLIENGHNMSDTEVFDLIFRPGFSTAEKVTDVSGRGVGMDVVKRGIEKLRGRVDISSHLGAGTTFTVRLPLTLAIIDSMLTRVGNNTYIIPTANILRAFRPTAEQLSTVTGRGEMVLERGKTMPIFRIHRIFNVRGSVTNPTEGLLLIVETDGQQCVLLVDDLIDQQQVVVKALGDGLGKTAGVSGGAILGDGSVGLILDVTALATLARGEKLSAMHESTPAACAELTAACTE